jgi:hypothetical protein
VAAVAAASPDPLTARYLFRLFVLVAPLVLATPACAAWTLVSSRNAQAIYADFSLLRVDGAMRRVWLLFDLPEPMAMESAPDGANSIRALADIDCRELRWRFLTESVHSGRMAGGDVLREQARPERWAYIAPETMAHDVLKRVCARRR